METAARYLALAHPVHAGFSCDLCRGQCSIFFEKLSGTPGLCPVLFPIGHPDVVPGRPACLLVVLPA